jgi:hypothetical protein
MPSSRPETALPKPRITPISTSWLTSTRLAGSVARVGPSIFALSARQAAATARGRFPGNANRATVGIASQAVLAIQWLWSGGRGRCSPRLPQIPA